MTSRASTARPADEADATVQHASTDKRVVAYAYTTMNTSLDDGIIVWREPVYRAQRLARSPRALCSTTRAIAIIATWRRFELARAVLCEPTMTNTLVTIEAEQLVTATGGAGSFIEPTLRQNFKGEQLERILKLPFAKQARILNAQLHRQ